MVVLSLDASTVALASWSASPAADPGQRQQALTKTTIKASIKGAEAMDFILVTFLDRLVYRFADVALLCF
jgi:hypothetical protein